MFVKERFELNDYVQDELHSLIPPFGYSGYGEFIFYRTYSRTKSDGDQESWADCVIRVVNGTLSIRKDWYDKNIIHWDEAFWQDYAKGFARHLFNMEWMPPGRGLWAMGSDFVFQRGAMALYNCAFTNFTTNELPEDMSWMMDSLMHGVGVGFQPIRDDNLRLYNPKGTFDYVIPDTREGWCESTRLLAEAFLRPNKKLPRIIYDLVRPAGLPIRGFGGISSGPEPLKELHQAMIEEFERYGTRPEYDSVYLKTNLGNRTGCCVVAGNVRRSAELACGSVRDPTFLDLKNYKKYPEREAFGWMSNNSVILDDDEDFELLGEIAKRVIRNGEPGYINKRNLRYGRIGKNDDVRVDEAEGFNPCGEIPLEHREVDVTSLYYLATSN
jgi:ribonucleoside-diphosphate reductase alpha chain